jgi:hypothetical protein
MPPAPAAIAAPPMMKSVASWIPAVPPPPVAGATLGVNVGVGLEAAAGVADDVGVDVSVGVPVGLPPAFAGRLTGAPEVVEVAGGVDEADASGGVDPPEQAAIAAQASAAMAPKPMTLSIALSPVPAMVLMVVRSFMEPPHAPRRCEGKAHGRHRHAMT